MSRTAALALVLAILPAGPGAAQRATGILDDVRQNTVRVEAGGQLGFGFIVGLRGSELLIATAWHTLNGPAGAQPDVCFVHRPDECVTGSVAYIADAVGAEPALDLAIVAAEPPPGLRWRPDVAARSARPGALVRFIGRSREWYVPAEPGVLGEAVPARRLLRYSGLPVARGVSGAPILSDDGIVAMHVESEGEGEPGLGVELAAIRERVQDHLRASWILRPRSSCEGVAEPQRRTLEARRIAVFVDPSRPDAALSAISRLRCGGAEVMPVIQARGGWPGDRVTYGPGELALVRAIQAVLAPVGRLETRLDQTERGDAEVWIR